MRNFFKSCKSSLRDRAELRQAGAQSVRVFLIPNKAPLVSGFLKGSGRTYIPPLCQWGHPLLRLCSFPHAIFTHFSAKSGIVNMCSWKEPEIHKAFSWFLPHLCIPGTAPPGPRHWSVSHPNAVIQGWESRFHS